MTDPADDIAALYERHAAAFDQDRALGGWPDRRWHERFAELLPAHCTILDLGCGSGRPVASYLAERGMCITGVDSSPRLIAKCVDRLPGHEWHVADMRKLALGRTFDGILAWDSFFHLCHDDQRAMFDVFAAHAADSALLLFNTGPDHCTAIGCYRGDRLYHASLEAAAYRTLLEAHRFNVMDHVQSDSSSGGRTVWLARRRPLSSDGRQSSTIVKNS